MTWLPIRNATAVPRAQVPHLEIGALHDGVVAAVAAGARVAALFVTGRELWCVLARPGDGHPVSGRSRPQGAAGPISTAEDVCVNSGRSPLMMSSAALRG